MTADEIIETLKLQPHPEGGHYRETWAEDGKGRPSGTCIYFLLKGGEPNRWHKVDAAEIWHSMQATRFCCVSPQRMTAPPALPFWGQISRKGNSRR